MLYIDNVIAVMRVIAPFCLLDRVGLKCGLCGGTHCVYYLSKGNIIDAFQANLLIPLAVLFFIIAYFICHMAYLFDFKWARKVMNKYIFTLPCFFSLTLPFLVYGLIRSIIAILK